MTGAQPTTRFAELKDFQQRTVVHALRRLYDDNDSTGRFLVADEVGMGKTLVARGVIAGAIGRLEHDRTVDRIDVLYICSNSEIARQNLSKLDVLDSGTRPLNTRITMLATQVHDLNRVNEDGSKTVNLVSFTPGTSFERGSRGGRMSERVVLHELVQPLFADRSRAVQNALVRVLRLRVAQRSWEYERFRTITPDRPPDPTIGDAFLERLRDSHELEHLEALVERATGRSELRDPDHAEAVRLVGRLRGMLATVSVNALEPDLVILDEFQRFKHLLQPPTDDTAEGEVAGLAQDLFAYPGVRVLLLSATPYKLFTLAEEKAVTGDDHYSDFMATMSFLLRNDAHSVEALAASFRRYRRALTDGHNVDMARAETEALLTRVMCRTERPNIGAEDMLEVRPSEVSAPTADELLGFVDLRRIAVTVDAPLSIDYWKSAPYFLNFMDGYKLGSAVRRHLATTSEPLNLGNVPRIQPRTITRREPLSAQNSRLRRLLDETVGSGMWRLLWMPASLPYTLPAGVYSGVDPATTTKRLIFSSWAAAPTAIAAVLSHEALRRMMGATSTDDPEARKQRLRYLIDGERPASMTTLMLFTPIPPLARLADPLEVARGSATEPVEPGTLVASIAQALEPLIPPPGAPTADASLDGWYWAAPFGLLGAPIADVLGTLRSDQLIDALDEDDNADEPDGRDARLRHLRRADEARIEVLGRQPADLAKWCAVVGAAAPGNIAWRALRRVTAGTAIADDVLLQAAAVIADGFRSLFNRPEVIALVDSLQLDGEAYWQQVLTYCLEGNLQAVMDEYLHHLVGNENPDTDEKILAFAERVRDVIALRTATVTGFDPGSPDAGLTFTTRFALRYGSARGSVKTDDSSARRLAGVQAAFNSPFWPMVLASTSVGQEGVDFHWWCHSLVHWNLPSNPADFDQREGRVHRFKGHAVRKNVAARHRLDALRAEHPDPWEAAFAAALAERPPEVADRLGDLWPWWVFPGEARIQRWIPCLPLSKDIERDERLRRLRGLYRLAFGQPRQEELVDLLADGADGRSLDLRPPIVPLEHRP